jgi:hypothetical protein
MTSVMLRDIVSKAVPNELHSKVNFDRVQEIEMKKPESTNPGLKDKTGDLVDKPQLNGIHYAPIVADSPNFRKEIGASMLDEGFIKLPRSLFNDPNWKGMREKYRRVFIILLFHTSFTQRSFGIGANIITIGPGQFCTSIRTLVDLCNDGIKYKDDKVDKNIVERAVSLFTKIGLVRQEVRHGKSILTITQRELYEHFQRQTETASETRPRLDRDTNEEREEREDMKETIDRVDRSPLLNKKEEEHKGPSIFDAEPASPQSKELSEENQKMLIELWKFAQSKKVNEGNTKSGKPGIKNIDLINWLKSGYEAKDIAEAIKIASNKEIRITFGAYITTLLKEKVPKKKGNIEINDEFLKEIMKKHPCNHLEVTKQYVTDKIKRVDYQKNTDPEAFKDMIFRSIEMSKNYEHREEDTTQEKEYDDDDY